MKQTFEELIKIQVLDYYSDINKELINDVLELLKQVRKATLEECANKVQTKENWWQDNGNPSGFFFILL